VAIIRFDDGAVKVVKGNEFLTEFQRRQNDPWWTTIECIQTCVHSKRGIGQLLNIQFFAPLCPYDADKPVLFDFKKMPEDADLLREGNDELYCIKQCLKIAYYVQLIHQTEVLQMKAEFLKDDYGNVRALTLDLVLIRFQYSNEGSCWQKRNTQG